MTLALENVEAVKKAMSDFVVDNHLDLSKKSPLEVADRCHLAEISLATINNLAKLAPFGMDNPKPRFLVEDYKVIQSRSMGKDNAHLKLKIQEEKQQIDAVYFQHGSEELEFEQAETKLVVTLSSNSWNGNTSLQLMIEDADSIGVELLDIRSRQISIPKEANIFA